ncbi:MAG: hypothetical protein HYR89_06160 [Actinobacteria bacterium]|nr:hypothetical protein [Actinomycetota bacterium]
MNRSVTRRSGVVSLSLLVISVLGPGSLAHAQGVGPDTGETTVPSTAPATEPATTAPTVPTTAPPEPTTTVTLPPTSETAPPAPAVKETVPRKREPAPTTRPTFVPPAGNPDVVKDTPGSGPLDDAGTRYLPLMVLLSLGGFAVAVALLAAQWYRTRPGA